jgi:hypothetical protein
MDSIQLYIIDKAIEMGFNPNKITPLPLTKHNIYYFSIEGLKVIINLTEAKTLKDVRKRIDAALANFYYIALCKR